MISAHFKGAGLILVASAFVAASTLCAKILGTSADNLSVIQITWGRYVFGFLAVSIAVVFFRPQFSTPSVPLHAVRVTCGVVGVTAMFAAASIIPLAEATAISFLNPVIAMVLAIPILKEIIGPIRRGSAAVALLGALLLIRPGTAAFEPGGLLALFAAIVLAIEVIALKLLSAREGAFQVVLIANACGALIATTIVFWFWQTPSSEQWFLLIATGVLMVMAQTLYTNALRLADASFVLPFSYAALLFAALYDQVLFDVVPVPLSVLGGCLIIISGIVLAWRDGKAKREQAPVRTSA